MSPILPFSLSLNEAKANLSRYARLCHQEPVIVTVNGLLSFELPPFEEDDVLIDRLLERHPRFRQLLEARLCEPGVSAKEAACRLLRRSYVSLSFPADPYPRRSPNLPLVKADSCKQAGSRFPPPIFLASRRGLFKNRR
jgi:hypothetical protein